VAFTSLSSLPLTRNYYDIAEVISSPTICQVDCKKVAVKLSGPGYFCPLSENTIFFISSRESGEMR
jgi:hypothetical protein